MAKKVFLGVGHGGSDPGAVKYVKESEANLVIALKVKEELERHGVIVGISRIREENDDISEEIREANAFKPDIALDIHNNAGGGDGFEALIQTNSYASKSKKLGQCVEKQVLAIGQNSRGMKTRLNGYGTDYFGFLRSVYCPSVILEGFFVDNAKDVADFDTIKEQQKLGVAYAKGILDYLDISYNGKVKEDDKPSYHDQVQKRFGFDNNTMNYLSSYKYAEALLEKLATKK